MSEKRNKLYISRFRGIWKSGYKEMDLIIINLTEGNTKYRNKDRRFLRITLCVHSFPNHGQHPANNCSWQNLSITPKRPKLYLGFWWDKPVIVLSVPQPAVLPNVQGQNLPNARRTKNCVNKALYVWIVAFLKFCQGWDLPGRFSPHSPQAECKTVG